MTIAISPSSSGPANSMGSVQVGRRRWRTDRGQTAALKPRMCRCTAAESAVGEAQETDATIRNETAMFPFHRQGAGVGPGAPSIRAAVKVGHGMVGDDFLGDVGGRATPGRAHEKIAIGQLDGVRTNEVAASFSVPDEDTRRFDGCGSWMHAADHPPHAQHGFTARACQFGGIVDFRLAYLYGKSHRIEAAFAERSQSFAPDATNGLGQRFVETGVVIRKESARRKILGGGHGGMDGGRFEVVKEADEVTFLAEGAHEQIGVELPRRCALPFRQCRAKPGGFARHHPDGFESHRPPGDVG